MRGLRRGWLGVAAAAAMALAAVLLGATQAAAAPVPLGLVANDGGSWRAENRFRLDWTNPLGVPVLAAHLSVFDESGAPVRVARLPAWPSLVDGIWLPRPGLYRAELALEGVGGELGSAVAVPLRFDNVPPGPVVPLPPSGWIGGEVSPLLRLGRPPAPLPVSGIRGYAVSVDRDPGGTPCQARTSCRPDELDLAGGPELDSLRVGPLPEGTLYVHAVAVSGSGLASAAVGTAPLRVDATPPTVRLEGVPAGWRAQPVTVAAVAADGLSGMTAAGPSGPQTALALGGDVPTVAAGPRAETTVAAEGAHRIVFYARDAAGNVSERREATVRIDRTPPRVAFADRLDPDAPETLVATVADGLSGPAPRGQIAIRPAGSGRPFAPLPTVATTGRLTARWDSDAYPPGSYELRASGFDAAGNSASTRLRANGTAMVLPNPLKARTSLLAGFGAPGLLVWHRCRRRDESRRCRREEIESFGRRPAARTVPFGRRLRVGGQLLAGGRPLGAAAVRVIELFDAGAARAPRERLLATGPDGSFAARLSAGPSRRVLFEFPGDRLRAASRGRELRVAVRGRVSMRASAGVAAVGGRPVLFQGRIADPDAVPPQGKAIELQFRLPGLPWSQFRTVRTGPDGAFRYPYRFSDDDSRGVRFLFRAVAPAEPGWPYEAATSRPLAVTGR